MLLVNVEDSIKTVTISASSRADKKLLLTIAPPLLFILKLNVFDSSVAFFDIGNKDTGTGLPPLLVKEQSEKCNISTS